MAARTSPRLPRPRPRAAAAWAAGRGPTEPKPRTGSEAEAATEAEAEAGPKPKPASRSRCVTDVVAEVAPGLPALFVQGAAVDGAEAERRSRRWP